MRPVPVIEPRGYQEILDEALARIPVHNPEWTNFNRSDPGVTLIELFAFLTESLAYRANQIPERSRRKFLSLLGLPLPPAASARGLVALTNERGPLETVTVGTGLEVRAGALPFRTTLGLDLLPVEGRAFVKRPLPDPPSRLVAHYRELYASHRGERPHLKDVQLYETTPIEAFGPAGAPLQATADSSLWIALLLRPDDDPALAGAAREALAGRTLSLGIVPVLADTQAQVGPAAAGPGEGARLRYQVPMPPPQGLLPPDPTQRVARYRPLESRATQDVLREPGVVQVMLPERAADLGLWENLDPLEAGAGDFPPSLEDTDLEPRLVTWLRVQAPPGAEATLLWAGVNAAPVSQRTEVAGETLGRGTGEPDQVVRLANVPVVSGSLRIVSTPETGGESTSWEEIDDLLAASPEVPVRDPRTPPGTAAPSAGSPEVFTLDPVTGEVRFGDGSHGRRPPAGTRLRADYAFGAGAAGNLAAGAIDSAPALGAGIRVANPVPTWGGADAVSVAEGEKHAARYLQHRDRLVTPDDFDDIVRRTPGVEIGRVEVLPTFNPQLDPPAPAPGAVTVLVLPRLDPAHPGAPEPDRLFLDAICRYIDPRRLVTTEVFLRGPAYVDLWVSIGIEVEAGLSVAVVEEDVEQAIRGFLAPLGADGEGGWPLGRPVHRLEIVTVAARVPGVRLVRDVQLAAGNDGRTEEVRIAALQLPRLRRVEAGPFAIDVDQLRGDAGATPPPEVVPVPVVPESC